MGDFLLNYWVDFVLGIAAAVAMAKLRKANQYIKEVDSAKNGVKALLRDRIIHQYNKYSELEHIPIYARDNVDLMFKEYQNLGGNGTIVHLVDKLHELPTK